MSSHVNLCQFSVCARANHPCNYREQSDDGIFNLLSSAKNIGTLGFGTLIDVRFTKLGVSRAVSTFFDRAGTWFPVIDKGFLEARLESEWKNLPVEVSTLVLCMDALDNPPNHLPSKGIKDTAYKAAKVMVEFALDDQPTSIELLQAQLLLAKYQFAQNLPRQAYRSLGDCIDMARELGWLNPSFWAPGSLERANQLLRCSILWHTIVYLDK